MERHRDPELGELHGASLDTQVEPVNNEVKTSAAVLIPEPEREGVQIVHLFPTRVSGFIE